MKNSTFTGILLTLVMLLMVAAAALIFLFPRQQTLSKRNEELTIQADQLRQDVASTGLELSASEATRTTGEAALATSEANSLILESELVKSDQELTDLRTSQADLTSQLAEASATMAELQVDNERMKSQFPFTAILAPENGMITPPEEPIDILIVAYDPEGLTAVNLTLDDRTFSFNGDDKPFFTHSQEWQPLNEGEHALSLMAINTIGEASEPISATIQMVDIDLLNASIRSELEANVLDLTGLTLVVPVDQTLITQTELRDRIESDFAEEVTPEDVRRDTLVLSTFDFLDQDYDLYTALIDLYSEGVLGFYDPETTEFVVVSNDDALDVAEQLTHVHEYVHALQDQHYNLDLIDDENIDTEAATAFRALAEGHASFVEVLYLTSGYFSDEEIEGILAAIEEEDSSYLENIPPIIVADLEFPYSAGFTFVMDIYQQGGFEALEEVWQNPPKTTEHILHPEQYRAQDLPQNVTLPDLTNALGEEWQLLDEDTFGEFYLRQYLGQQLNEDSVKMAATGWDGDRYAVYENKAEGELVMVLRLAWDEAAEGAEFNEIFPQYPAYLFETNDSSNEDGLECWSGSDAVICLYVLGEDSLIMRTPDVETAVRIVQAFE
jgi:hypothetical protein